MPTLVLFDQAKENFGKSVHDFTSDATCTLMAALCNAANAPSVSADAVLADLVEIAYTNFASREITGVTCEQTSGTAPVTATDKVISVSGGSGAPFRYVVIYDDVPTSPNKPLIGYLDLGQDETLTDGSQITLDFGANGLFTIGG